MLEAKCCRELLAGLTDEDFALLETKYPSCVRPFTRAGVSSPHPTAGCHLSRSRVPHRDTNALRTGAGSEGL